MMGSMSSAPSEESVASGFFKRTVRAFSASITMQDPYNVARKGTRVVGLLCRVVFRVVARKGTCVGVWVMVIDEYGDGD